MLKFRIVRLNDNLYLQAEIADDDGWRNLRTFDNLDDAIHIENALNAIGVLADSFD
jgi:hypothetical protein